VLQNVFAHGAVTLVFKKQNGPTPADDIAPQIITDVSRNLATVVVRGIFPGLRRRRTGLLPSGPKSSFHMRASFVFNLETKVLESGGRVEKLIAQVA